MKVICIDPGHDNCHPGNVNFGVKESDTNLSLSYRLQHYISLLSRTDDNKLSQATTVLTRLGKEHSDINNRVAFVKAQKPDVFVSIHTNSWIRQNRRGCEAYYNLGSNYLWSSVKLGNLIVEGIAELGIPNNGVKRDSLTAVKSLGVLRGTNAVCPAILIEVGYASNPIDASVLSTRNGQEILAIAIARAILTHLGIKPRLDLLG